MPGLVERLLGFLDIGKDFVTAETIVQVKDLARKYPDIAEVCVGSISNISLEVCLALNIHNICMCQAHLAPQRAPFLTTELLSAEAFEKTIQTLKWALARYSCSAHRAGCAGKDDVWHGQPAYHLHCLACATWQSQSVRHHYYAPPIFTLYAHHLAVSVYKTQLLSVSHVYSLCVYTCRMWKSLRPEQLSSGS